MSKICKRCNGSGQAKCPKCDGRGWLEDSGGNLKACDQCQKDGKVECPICHGSGEIH